MNNFYLLLLATCLSGCAFGPKFTYDQVNNIRLGATTNEVAQIMPPPQRKTAGPAGYESWAWFYSVTAGPMRFSAVIFNRGRAVVVRRYDYVTDDELKRLMTAISEHQILMGMTPMEVQASWGPPETKTQSVSHDQLYEAWFYPDRDTTVSLYRKNEPCENFHVTEWTTTAHSPDRTKKPGRKLGQKTGA